ncbi:hypothetical protein HMPREF1872_00398 [Amygdalobacter nucleatus]|uniref:Uncharacterized protein n=1 Tax=Amygdalobacter nucleatus TaxID=3029274 RepID=A0A133YGA9_9FIRM|nr:hypothetical protein HMPREF1872_00398 [Amygdalobacter nucleatus]
MQFCLRLESSVKTPATNVTTSEKIELTIKYPLQLKPYLVRMISNVQGG